MWTGRGRARVAGIVVAGLAMLGGVAACSATSHSSSTERSAGGSSAYGVPAPKPGGQALDGSGAAANAPKTAPTSAQLLPAVDQRSIIYQGSITVRVSDVNAAAAQAYALAIGDGGYVGSDQRTIDAQSSVASLTLRIPSAQFAAALTALSGFGHEQNRQVSTQDVTQQVVDVQSRIKTEQASVDRIRTLLGQATSIGDIVSIESELTTREANLESMEAQLRSLSDLTALSTIAVTLLGPQAKVVPPPANHIGFVAGLKSGWHTFLNSVNVVLNVIGAVLPFVIVIGVPLWIVVALLRRRRRSLAGPSIALVGGGRTDTPDDKSS